MPHAPAPSVAAIGGRPLHAMLVPFPIACLTLTLGADIAYWATGNLMWQHFAEWLLLIALVTGAFAALVGAIDLLVRRPLRRLRIGWIHGIGNLVALGLAVVNSFVHARDGWTGVVPWGIVLSALTVAVMAVTFWLGLSMVFRHGAGVARHG
ncbi:DUF2231 domain-containing protein [Cereibacter johrii]|uniref:Membrane protein n=1 Tax=Cereibacter johrii TaxID=445629 RepID=A0ABX5JHK2_9RHOB|nr:DUF2231 domain-containing protein [Cereibacter johrii]ODM41284.1 hypothetical protein A9O63_08485 [Cereibacter johrii]PTM81201.1 putative membrane protein [Cereibacter johrii]RAZ86769.1 DUF2231 domain-containing protein [Cereibacter johrii]